MADIRFLLDEHVGGAVTHALRRRGIETVSAADAGLLGAADMEYLAFAREHAMVIVTQDADFLALHGAGEQHAGIVYCAQGSRSVGEIVGGLALIHDILEHAEMAGRVEFL